MVLTSARELCNIIRPRTKGCSVQIAFAIMLQSWRHAVTRVELNKEKTDQSMPPLNTIRKLHKMLNNP
jgi:hypothetical protein